MFYLWVIPTTLCITPVIKFCKLGVVAHSGIALWRKEVGRSGVQGHSQLPSNPEASLGCRRHLIKKGRKGNRGENPTDEMFISCKLVCKFSSRCNWIKRWTFANLLGVEGSAANTNIRKIHKTKRGKYQKVKLIISYTENSKSAQDTLTPTITTTTTHTYT